MKKLLLPVLFFVAFPIHAANNYITDSFEITMRTGQGTKHKIIKNLASGTRVQVVERDDENGYTLVRTSDGNEGWVLSRYLQDQPVAKQRLVSANQQIASLKNDLADNQKALSTLRSEHDALLKQHDRTSGSNAKIQKELEHIKRISSKEISLHDENEKLKTDLLTMERKLQTLEQDNVALRDRSARDWFLVGAGVCVIGIFLGLLLPRLRSRKASSWGSI